MGKFQLRGFIIVAFIVATNGSIPVQAAPPPSGEAKQLLDDAASACRRGEFYEFLDAFIASAEVRARYRDVASEPFRIGKLDFLYVDPESLALAHPDPKRRFTQLAVDVTDLPGKGRRVTYQPAIFRDDGEGDGQVLVRRTGKPSSYLFAWKDGCWRLSPPRR